MSTYRFAKYTQNPFKWPLIPLSHWQEIETLASLQTDLAFLALLPMAIAIYLAVYRSQLSLWIAQYSLVVRSTSHFYNLLNGKVRAHVNAFLFSVTTVPILGWQYVVSSSTLITVLILLIIAVPPLSVLTQARQLKRKRFGHAKAQTQMGLFLESVINIFPPCLWSSSKLVSNFVTFQRFVVLGLHFFFHSSESDFKICFILKNLT